eukprot:TRINITY_DN34_c0_g3_i1.p1 TRINITY_DN34_c0_g3~~TRINITY_DN34_c0_g3_i1.p1  ORF type:complete len:1068 (-),score=87.57 TRINITY_DN34_c0_g3_i1:166-3369(-)
MSPHREFFESIEQSRVREVIVANGEKLNVEGEGFLDMRYVTPGGVRKIKVRFLFVPEMAQSLVSLAQLAGAGFEVNWNRKAVTVCKKGDNCIPTEKRNSCVFVKWRAMRQSEKLSTEKAIALASKACKKKRVKYLDLHRRYGHAGIEVVRLIAKRMGVALMETEKVCDACQEGKMREEAYKKQGRDVNAVNDLVSADNFGPTRKPCILTGEKYAKVMVDHFSDLVMVFVMKRKSDNVKYLKVWIRRMGKPKLIRTDGAGELEKGEYKRLCTELEIRHERRVPYTPTQLGKGEAYVRVVIEVARVALIWSLLDEGFWGMALKYAQFAMNSRPLARLGGQSPFEVAKTQLHIATLMRPFGCRALVKRPIKTAGGKFGWRGEEGVFLGYFWGVKGWIFMLVKSRKIVCARTAIFFEDDPGGLLVAEGIDVGQDFLQSDLTYLAERDIMVIFTHDGYEEIREKKMAREVQRGAANESSNESATSAETERVTIEDVSDERDEEETEEEDDEETTEEDILDEKEVGKAMAAAIADEASVQKVTSGAKKSNLPRSFKKAMESGEWRDAIREEIDNHDRNKTFEWEKDTGQARRKVDLKWVFDEKSDGSGKIIKRKARLVARGFSQTRGVDYEYTYAGVTDEGAVRLVIAEATRRGYFLFHIDVSAAYLNAILDFAVYVHTPEGFKGKPGCVLRILKALYGLKQSGRLWNEKLKSVLQEIGWKITSMNECMVVKGDDLMTFHVDDLIGMCKNKERAVEIAKELGKFFKVKLMELKEYLGVRIRQYEGRTEMDQTRYLRETLERFGLEHVRLYSTPAECGVLRDDEDEQQPTDITLYRSMVGALLWMARSTRPDIAFAVQQLCCAMHAPTVRHRRAATRVFGYLRATAERGLVFRRQSGDAQLMAYADSSWGGATDGVRSISGWCVSYAGSWLMWRARRQKVVALNGGRGESEEEEKEITALSSAEAELRAVVDAVKEVIYIRGLSKEVGIVCGEATIVYNDNSTVIHSVTGAKRKKAMKHLRMLEQFVKERVESGEINVLKKDGKDLVADVFTKPLDKKKFWMFASRLISKISTD